MASIKLNVEFNNSLSVSHLQIATVASTIFISA